MFGIRPHHVFRRVDDMRVRHFGELYDFLEPGQLLEGSRIPEYLAEPWRRSRADSWSSAAAQPHAA